MSDIIRIENETCHFYRKPCVEDECPEWKSTRLMSQREYES